MSVIYPVCIGLLALMVLLASAGPLQAGPLSWQLVSPRTRPEIPSRLHSQHLAFDKEGIWEHARGRYLRALPFDSSLSIWYLAWAEPWLLALDNAGQVHQAQLTSQQAIFWRAFPYQHPETQTTMYALTHSSHWLASLNELHEGQQVFWIRDLRSGELSAEFSLPETEPGHRITAWDLEGEYLAIARSNPLQPMLEIWHWPSMQQVKVIDGPHTPVQELQFNTNTLTLQDAFMIHCWDVKNGQKKQTCPALLPKTPPDAFDYGEMNGLSLLSSLWYQPASAQWLQAELGKSLRWWPQFAEAPREYDICKQLPEFKPFCLIEVTSWSAHWVQLNVYADWPIMSTSLAATALPIPVQHLVLNLNTGQIEHRVTLEPKDPAGLEPVCLGTRQWVFVTGQEEPQLLVVNQNNHHQQYWPLADSHAFVHCVEQEMLIAENLPQTYARRWRIPGSAVSWLEQEAENQHLQALSSAYELYQHTLYDYLIRKAHDPLIPPAYLMPAAYLSTCQQADQQVYCQNTQQQWSVLTLDETPLQLRPLDILRPSDTRSEKGIALGKSQLFQSKKRQVLHLAVAGGRVWVTDQGHFFRQGEIAAAEMPYLVQGLKSVDLPARLESWAEVERALKGLPPLQQTAYQLRFYPEDL